MTAHSVAHAGFTLVREYPVPVTSLWRAFAEEEQKRAWYGTGDYEPGEWRFDFRVGGTDVSEGQFHGGPFSRAESRYTDIVEESRIVVAYDMWLDGRHISTSVASFEFEQVPAGSRLTHAEHGIHLDGLDDPAGRRAGSAGNLESLAAFLT